jgi:hypothetical protein
MPIAILIAIFVALFALGANMNQPKGSPARVVIVGGKQYYQVTKKDNRDTLVLMAHGQHEHTITINGQREPEAFENIFQLSGLYQIIKAEPMTAINNSINSNIKRAVCLSEKE